MGAFFVVAVILTIIYIGVNVGYILQDIREKPMSSDSYIEEYAVDPTDDINSTSVVEQGEDGLIIGGVAQDDTSFPHIVDTSSQRGDASSIVEEGPEIQKNIAEKQEEYKESVDDIRQEEGWSNTYSDLIIRQDIINPQPLDNGVGINILPLSKEEIKV